MKTKLFIGNTGERFSILLDDHGMPTVYPNLFVTSIYRNADQSSSSCQKALEHISYLYEICNGLKIDIEGRVARGEFLTHQEISKISYFTGITRDASRERFNKPSKLVDMKPRKSRLLETARHVLVVEKEKNKVFWQTKYNRITVFGRYVSWLERYHHPYKESKTEPYFFDLRPEKTEGLTYGEIHQLLTYKSLDNSERVTFLDKIRPDYSDNPWKDPGVRMRNYAMCMLLDVLGVRLGECLNIKLEDFVVRKGQRFLLIKRSPGDVNDNRINQPRVKTNSRALALTPKLQNIIDTYITEHRSRVENVGKTTFLFVSHRLRDGIVNPLSISAAEKIFAQLSKILGFNLHPHRLRHTWNDRYSASMDKLIAEGKTNEEKSEADRCHLMGWQPGSTMALVYSSRHNAKRAMEFALNMQDADFAEKESIAYDEDLPF
jgi:integrase